MPAWLLVGRKWRKEQSVTIKPTEKAKFMKLWNENGSIKARRRKNYGWICSSGIRRFSGGSSLCPFPFLPSIIQVHGSSGSHHHSPRLTVAPLQAIPFTRSSRQQGLEPRAGRFFKMYMNMIFTKPETESDEARVVSYLTFRQDFPKGNKRVHTCGVSVSSMKSWSISVKRSRKKNNECEPSVDALRFRFASTYTQNKDHQSASCRMAA